MSNKTQCAIYTRVSTNRQSQGEFTSCESQEDKIRSFIDSQDDWQVVKTYSDSGYTGANTDRPDLQQLLKDLEKEKFDAVVVYKIDRLTRSPKDFYQLIEFFEQKDIDFVSITERFDTSIPSGRLLRNIMLTFAQFERELASERTKDKMIERAKKGFWNGGIPPFGYKKKDKKLVIKPKEAEVIRTIFEKYLETKSKAKLYEFLKKQGIKNRKDNLFVKSTLGYLLKNPVYTGKVRYSGEVYGGKHKAIISEEIFGLAQKIHGGKKKKFRVYKDFLFGGLITCKECGSKMTNSFTNKHKDGNLKRYHYYRCTSTTKQDWDACSVKQVSADRLERYVLENLERISKDKEYLKNLVFRLNNASDTPHRTGNELTEENSKFSLETISSTLKFFLTALNNKLKMEKNLIARKFIKEIIYSPEQIKISFYYREKPKKLLKQNKNTRRQASAKSEENCKKEKDRKRKENKFVKNSLAPGAGLEPAT